MSLLFGGKPEEVPLRRQILRVVLLGLATLLVGCIWGLTLWSIQASRGGANSNCDNGIYSAVGVSAWICVAIFVAIVVYIMLIVAGVVPNPKKEKAPLEAPLDAEASVE